MPTQAQLIKMGTALAILYGVYKFVPNAAARAAALGVAGVVIAKQVPVLKDTLA
jgi:hypothetical protein